jgi:hypothetical protein
MQDYCPLVCNKSDARVPTFEKNLSQFFTVEEETEEDFNIHLPN